MKRRADGEALAAIGKSYSWSVVLGTRRIGDLDLAENRQWTAFALPLLFRGLGFLSRPGARNLIVD